MNAASCIVVVLLAVLASGPASAQGFRALAAEDAANVWAVGDQGLLYRSYDGGLHWTARTLGSATLRDVAPGARPIVVADSGHVWRFVSGNWTYAIVAGAIDLRSIAMVSDSIGWVVGAQGTILVTGDAGASFGAQASGTTARLEAVRFVAPNEGWAAGEGGVVLHTVDGGAEWHAVAVPTTRTLYSVDASGPIVWVVGEGGAAWRSTDGGVNWEPRDLGLDSRADVRVVRLVGQDVVWLAGGGGFIRKSEDAGETWSFPVHPLQGQISDLEIAGGSLWACSNRHRVIGYSTNGGATWAMPPNSAVTREWAFEQAGGGASVRGSTFALHPLDRDVIFCVMGATIYRSPNAGDTWIAAATIPGVSRTNAFLMSPRDSNELVVAVAEPKRVMHSADRGANWTTSLTPSLGFGDYGIPLERDPDHPDTLYFGGDYSVLHRSVDGGASFEPWSSTSFRSPCDIVVIPDSTNVILLGDGITGFGQGEYWKSVNSGQSFALVDSRPMGASEIPGMSVSRLRHSVAFGTNWGSGGVQRSTDYGQTWPGVHAASSAWGVDVADDDPNAVVFGTYGAGSAYLSFDGGTTFVGTPISGVNYGFYYRDRETLLALQGGGIYRLVTTFTHEPGGVAAVDPARATAGFALEQNRPNPFDGSTEIAFTVPRETPVSLEVFDLQGQRVATLFRGTSPAGSYRVAFRPEAARGGGRLPAGVYFLRLEAGVYAATRKMLLLR